MHAAKLFEVIAESRQLGNEFDAAFDEQLAAFVNSGATIVCMLGFSSRKRTLRLRDTVNILQLREIPALLEVLQTGEADCFDRAHYSDSES